MAENVYSLHDTEGGGQVIWNNRRRSCQANEAKLEEGVVLANGGGVDLGRGEREVPVPGECLGGRQGDPSVVDCSDSEADVTAEDDGGKPYCSRTC